MAQIRIGKIRFTVDGVWNSATPYSMLSTVTNSALTKVYVSKVDSNTNHNPDEDTQGTYWQLIVDADTAVDNATKKEIVTKTASDTAPEIVQNKMYEFPEMASLDITLATPTANILNEYQFSFDSGSTATTFSVPSGVVWTSTLSIKANMHYECNIVYNSNDDAYYGIIVGWSRE